MIFQHKMFSNLSCWSSIELFNKRDLFVLVDKRLEEFNNQKIRFKDLRQCSLDDTDKLKPLIIKESTYVHGSSLSLILPQETIAVAITNYTAYSLFKLFYENVLLLKDRFFEEGVFRQMVAYLNNTTKEVNRLTKVCTTCNNYLIKILVYFPTPTLSILELEKRVLCCSQNIVNLAFYLFEINKELINRITTKRNFAVKSFYRLVYNSIPVTPIGNELALRKIMYHPMSVVFQSKDITTIFYDKDNRIIEYNAETDTYKCPFNHFDEARGYEKSCNLPRLTDESEIDVLYVRYSVNKDYMNLYNHRTNTLDGEDTIAGFKLTHYTSSIREDHMLRYKFGSLNKYFCEKAGKTLKIDNLILGKFNGK